MNNESNSLNTNSIIGLTIGWIFGISVMAVGILNMFLVHLVPGIIYLLLSFVYIPNTFLKRRIGFSIPLFVKFALAVVIIMFTLGVSDLGDMIDRLLISKD